MSWLDDVRAPKPLKAGMRGFRGFFLADPEDLSLLPLVEQFAESGPPGRTNFFRIKRGNDRLATTIVKRLRGAVLLNTVVRRVVQHDERVTVTIDGLGKPHTEITAEYFVCALPESTARGVIFEPALPEPQQDAIAHLRYGCVTRLLLQFDRGFWRKAGRPRAFGTDLDTGAMWDGNEQQKGPNAILSFLAGGRASRALQDIVHAEGERGVIDRITWAGRPSRLVASQMVVWDHVRGRRGGYARSIRRSIRCGARVARASRQHASSLPASTRASNAGLHERRDRDRTPRRGGIARSNPSSGLIADPASGSIESRIPDRDPDPRIGRDSRLRG